MGKVVVEHATPPPVRGGFKVSSSHPILDSKFGFLPRACLLNSDHLLLDPRVEKTGEGRTPPNNRLNRLSTFIPDVHPPGVSSISLCPVGWRSHLA